MMRNFLRNFLKGDTPKRDVTKRQGEVSKPEVVGVYRQLDAHFTMDKINTLAYTLGFKVDFENRIIENITENGMYMRADVVVTLNNINVLAEALGMRCNFNKLTVECIEKFRPCAVCTCANSP